MAKTVRVEGSVQVFGDGLDINVPHIYSATLSSSVTDGVISVGATTTVDLWAAGDLGLAALTFLHLTADGALMLELTTDTNGSIGDELYTVRLAALAPFTLASGVSYANYTANFGGGTLDVIDRLRVRNLGASAVSLRYVIA